MDNLDLAYLELCLRYWKQAATDEKTSERSAEHSNQRPELQKLLLGTTKALLT